MDGKGIKVVAKNSKAYHDYFIEDKYEASWRAPRSSPSARAMSTSKTLSVS